MKNVITAFCLLMSCAVFSQSFTPTIRQGTKLHYEISTNDGPLQLVVKLDSVASNYMKLGWSMDGGNQGSWIMKKNSIEGATEGWWGELAPDSRIELPDNQSVAMFSKAQWNAIQKDKKVSFDQISYTVKTPSEQQRFKLGDKEVSTILLEGTNGSSRIWLLNSPSFPFILKIEGNQAGPDISVKSID